MTFFVLSRQAPVVVRTTSNLALSERVNIILHPTMNNVKLTKKMPAPLTMDAAKTSKKSTLEKLKNEIEKLEKKPKTLLNSHQKAILTKSWSSFCYRHSPSNENIGVRIYLKVFEKMPETKEIFGFQHMSHNELLFNERFNTQAKRFISVIDDAILNIDVLDTVVRQSLFALGGRHVKMRDLGFKLQHWDVFAESMLECIIESQGIRRHRDTTSTWRLFIVWLIEAMKDGYYSTVKKQRRSTLPSVGEDESTESEELPVLAHRLRNCRFNDEMQSLNGISSYAASSHTDH